MIRRRKKRSTAAKSRSDLKVCPACGVPFAFVNRPDRQYYDWYVKKSFIWKAIREWALERAKYKCERCGATFPLQVHHKTYIRLGKEMPSDLEVLCESCHEKEHE